jgi:hypothetical protein
MFWWRLFQAARIPALKRTQMLPPGSPASGYQAALVFVSIRQPASKQHKCCDCDAVSEPHGRQIERDYLSEI